MPTTDHIYVPPLALVREIVRARRIAAQAAAEAMLAALAPETTADTWMDVGAMSQRATSRLARSVERTAP